MQKMAIIYNIRLHAVYKQSTITQSVKVSDCRQQMIDECN